MMKCITFGNLKGGVAKTTSTAIISFLLALKGFKVLAVDMDPQGNLGEMLTLKDSEEFAGISVYEAIKEGNAEPYIQKVDENLDLLPSMISLGMLSEWLYTPGNLPNGVKPQEGLKRALSSIIDRYDFILIDTSPSLGELLTNALTTSTHAIGCVDAAKPSVTGLRHFLNTVDAVRNGPNPNLRVCGVLASLLDNRRADNKKVLLKLKMLYEGIMFEDIIKRVASTGRLYLLGFSDDNPEINEAVEQYIPIVKEVLTRG